MVETRSCDYCGSDIEPGTGTMYVHVDGRVVHFCSSKCENNAELGRASRDLEWTAEGQRIGASRAGTADEVEQVAADSPASEDETVAEDLDTVEDESEAQAVAAATSDVGETESGGVEEVAGRTSGGEDPDIDEDSVDEDTPMEERDADEAEANVGDEMVRESDEEDDSDEDDQ